MDDTGKQVAVQTLGKTCLNPGSVACGKLFNWSVPGFPHLRNGIIVILTSECFGEGEKHEAIHTACPEEFFQKHITPQP